MVAVVALLDALHAVADLRGRRSRVQIRYLQATLKDPPSMSRVFDALDMTPEQQVNRARETEFLWQGGQSARGAPRRQPQSPRSLEH